MACMAVRLVSFLFERPLVQLFETERTDKVFGVKLAEHGSDAPARNGLLTGGTRRPSHVLVMSLAIWIALVLEKVALHKRLVALSAHEAGRMPRPVQRGDVVFSDGGVATATLGSKGRVVAVLAVGIVLSLVVAIVPKWL